MTMLLEPPVRHWACPSCQMEAETITPGVRMHPCRGLNGLTVSMVEVPKAGTMPHARHRVLERQDYCADVDRVMSVLTDYPDGRNDCTVYPITARFDVSALTPGHNASTVGGSITVTPGTAGVGVANFRRPVIHDPITARMYELARRSGARMAWSASVERLSSKGVPIELARRLANLEALYGVLDVTEVSVEQKRASEAIAALYYALGGELELRWISEKISHLPTDTSLPYPACPDFFFWFAHRATTYPPCGESFPLCI